MDDELVSALDGIDPSPSSRSRLVRDLALRGAAAIQEERTRADDALAILSEIADGTRDHDFAAVADAVARRGDRLP